MLPDFGWTELLVIAIVLIVVVGPKDLPRVIRGFSKSLGSMRKMAGDFRKQFDDALSEAELDDLKTLANDVKSMDPRNSIKDALNPLSKVGQEINNELRGVANSIEAPVTDSPASRKVSPQEAYPQLNKTPDEVKPAAKKAAAKKAAPKKPAAKKVAATKKPVAKKPAAKAPATAKARTMAAKKTTTAKKPPAATKAKSTPRKRATAKTPAKSAGDKA